MSDGNDKKDQAVDQQREEMADVEEELDERSGQEGLAAEAGRGEETGLAEG